MEYVQAVNSILLYGNILMQNCDGSNAIRKARILEAVNEVLNEISDRVLLQKMVVTDNNLKMSLQKLMNLR